MTYHEDVAAVKGSFKEMLENGVYKINTTKDYATQIAEKQEIISQRYECGRDPRKTEIKP